MDPFTAAILIGSFVQNEKNKQDAIMASRRAEKQASQNRNALVEESFAKKNAARGLGQGSNQNTGLVASQSGAVLQSVQGGANSLV